MDTRSNGDDRIREATGRARAGWYALLDDVSAREWDHHRIARWLGGEHDVDGWWAQSVAVGYEQSRGLREPGERADGSREASATKTLHTTAEELWPHLADEELRADWLDVEWPMASATATRTLRLVADDGSRVTLRIDPLAPGQDGREKVRLVVAHSRLPGGELLAETKKFWRDALAALAEVIDR